MKKIITILFFLLFINTSHAFIFDIFKSDRDWCRETLLEYGLAPGSAAKHCGADVDKSCMKDLMKRGLAPGAAAKNCS